MASEILKQTKRAVDLAIAAGRKRQSPRTGFVHLFSADENASDTIPLYENFCFAFALFRQRTTEAVLEGISLLDRLLAFQTSEGNFPIYLHDFPRCWDSTMSLRIAPILVQIVRHFGSVMGTEIKEKILAAVDRSMEFASERTRAPLWEHRYRALRRETTDFTPVSAEEWFEWLVSAQLIDLPIGEIPYHQGLMAFIGGGESQEKGEPTPWPIEWILAEKEGFSERLLRDHPAALRSAVLFPVELPAIVFDQPCVVIEDSEGVRWLWRGSKLHSLTAPNGRLEGDRILFSLADPVDASKRDLIEAAVFSDLSPETEVTIEGKRGMVFQLGDRVQIRTPACAFELSFHLIEGSGDFSGQISRGNRPAQTACKGDLRFEAFDWQISIRTLRRSPGCKLAVCYEVMAGAAAAGGEA